PTTLIALAKAVAYGWRQESAASNAAAVAELGRELYKRLATLGGHVVEVGNAIERGVKAYNNLVGSLESQVMPQARRFDELQANGGGKPLPDLSAVETTVRVVRSGRDLTVTPEDRRQTPESLGARRA